MNNYDSPRYYRGFRLEFSIEYDTDYGPPWEVNDCHGEVSEWTSRDKAPGELLLYKTHKGKLFYDFQGMVKDLRKQGIPGEKANKIAKGDYEYLRRWCDHDWYFVGCVLRIYMGDSKTPFESSECAFDSLWGIESDNHEYQKEIFTEMEAGAKEAIDKYCAKLAPIDFQPVGATA